MLHTRPLVGSHESTLPIKQWSGWKANINKHMSLVSRFGWNVKERVGFEITKRLMKCDFKFEFQSKRLWCQLRSDFKCGSLFDSLLQFVSKLSVPLQELFTYWIRTSMTLHWDQWENVISSAPLTHMHHAVCVCVWVAEATHFLQMELNCRLQITCYWISLFTPRTRVQLTLIMPSYLVDDVSPLLWFNALCSTNQHATPLFVLFRVKTGKNPQLYLHGYCKHK